jgi:hypothetical protein
VFLIDRIRLSFVVAQPIFPPHRRQHESRKNGAVRDALLAANGVLLCIVGVIAALRPFPVLQGRVTAAEPIPGPAAPTPSASPRDTRVSEIRLLTPFLSGRDCDNRFPFEREREPAAKRAEWAKWQITWDHALHTAAQDLDKLGEDATLIAVFVTAGHDIVPLEDDESDLYGSNQTLAHVRATCLAEGLRNNSSLLKQNRQVPVLILPVGAGVVPAVVAAPGTRLEHVPNDNDRTARLYVWTLANRAAR